MKPKDSANAIICWKDKILLFHRDNIPTIPAPDCWQNPGGGIEVGETPLQGLKRELLEEVSYYPKNIEFLGKIKKKDGFTSYIYVSFVTDDEAKLFKHGMGEGQEIKFFTIDEMDDLKLTFKWEQLRKLYKEDLKIALKTRNFRDIFPKLKDII